MSRKLNQPYFKDKDFTLYNGHCVQVLKGWKEKFDMIFADPPYFLSGDGYTIQSGEIVSVHKGDWDKLPGEETVNKFNYEWIAACRNALKANGCIWISGTMHNIYSIAQQLDELNFRILNSIVWQKTNPPPNFTKRFFTHSSEIIIWARKEKKVPHYFNYELMKALNEGKQMQDVWKLPAIAPWEKSQGKHPVQKPLAVLCRIVLASTKKGDLIVDPFSGSGTTGIAANLLDRKFIGIDIEKAYLDISVKRKSELTGSGKPAFLKKINGINIDAMKAYDK